MGWPTAGSVHLLLRGKRGPCEAVPLPAMPHQYFAYPFSRGAFHPSRAVYAWVLSSRDLGGGSQHAGQEVRGPEVRTEHMGSHSPAPLG